MLKELIKNNIRFFTKDFRITKDSTPKEALKSLLIIIAIIFLAISFGALYYSSYYESAIQFASYNLGWLYFSYAALSTIFIIALFSITMSISYLFESKDDDMLLTMPIKKEYILVSRFTMIFIFIYAISMICLIPTLIAWVQFNQLPVFGYISFTLCLLTYPLLPIGLSAIIAYYISKLSKKTGAKNAIKFIFTIGIVVVYELVVGNMSYGLELVLDNYAAVINVGRYLIPLNWFGQSIASGNILKCLGVVIINVGGFWLIIKFLAKRYFGILGSSYNVKHKEYVEKHYKTHSVITTLLKKELNVMVKTFAWAINWMFGLVILVVGMVVVLFYAERIKLILITMNNMQQLGQLLEILPMLAVMAVCFITSTALIAPCGISYEGKKLWILKISPISSEDILLAKAFAQLIFTLPISLLAGLEIVLILRPTLSMSLNVFFILIGFTLSNALFGVYINCKHPMLDWINEQQPCKQSAASIIALLLPMLLIGGLAAIYYFLLMDCISLTLYASIVSAVMGLLAVFSFVLLMDKGKKAFERLN